MEVRQLMLRNQFVALNFLFSGLALGEVSLSFEYRGVFTGVQTQNVHSKVIRRGQDLYVESSGGRISERYLQIGDKALRISISGSDRDAFAILTHAGLFRGIPHIPYLPDVGVLGDLGLAFDQHTTFFRISSGSVLTVPESPGQIFRMPVVRRGQVDGGTTIYARLEAAVWAKVTQRGFAQVGSWEIPQRSEERYHDGRGEFSYEWSLVRASFGEDVPELPTFESLLGAVATDPFGVGERSVHVQDVRNAPIVSFSFHVNRGNLYDQIAERKRIDGILATQDREAARLQWQRRAPWVGALVGGVIAMGIGAVVYWRRRGAPS